MLSNNKGKSYQNILFIMLKSLTKNKQYEILQNTCYKQSLQHYKYDGSFENYV